MDFTLEGLIVFLAVFTIAVVAVFALVSKKRTEKRKQDSRYPKSTLAEDAPNRTR